MADIAEFSYESSVSRYVDQHLELETSSDEDSSDSETPSQSETISDSGLDTGGDFDDIQ